MSRRPRPRPRSAFVCLLLACLFVPVTAIRAQNVNENETVGFQSNHAFGGGGFGENIDLLNGSLNLSIPIGSARRVNQNLAHELTLSYGSKIWDTSGWGEVLPAILERRGPLGLGFNLHHGRIYRDVARRNGKTGWYNDYTWFYVSPDGNQHEIPALDKPSDFSCGDEKLRGTTIDNTWFVHGLLMDDAGSEAALRARLRDNPSIVRWQIEAAEGIVYTFGHYVDVLTSSGGRFNSTQCLGIPEGKYTAYNRDFGGWYVTEIRDKRAVADVWIRIEYDTRAGYDHAISRITDSAGRTIVFSNGCEPDGAGGCKGEVLPGEPNPPRNPPHRISVRTESIAIPAFKGTLAADPAVTAVYGFIYEYRDVSNIDGDSPASPASLLKQITLPEFRTHAGVKPRYSLSFQYNSYGELGGRMLPTGASIAYGWGGYSYAAVASRPNAIVITAFTRQLVRKDITLPGDPATYSWFYTRPDTFGSNPQMLTVRDPFGNDTVYHFRASMATQQEVSADNMNDGFAPEWDDGVNYKTEFYMGTGNGRRLVRTELRDYESDRHLHTFGVKGKVNVRVQRSVTVFNDDGGRQAVVAFADWDGLGHYRVRKEIGEGIPGTRVVRTLFGDFDPSRPLYVEVSDGSRVLSRQDNIYQTSGLRVSIDRAIVPGTVGSPHNQTPGPGDVTMVYTYDTAGNVVLRESTFNGYTYSGGLYTAITPEYRIRYGYHAGGYLATKEFHDRRNALYYPWKAIDRGRDGNTGLVFESRDPAGVKTSYVYDELGRLRDILPAWLEYPTQIEYLDVLHTSVRQGDPSYMPADFTCGAYAGDFIMSCYEYDALGRLIRTQKRPADPAQGIPYQKTSYDIAGRVTFRTEWLRPGGAEVGTAYDYTDPGSNGTLTDPFGRTRKQTTADGQVAETRYFGPSSAVTVRGIRGTTGGTFDATTTYHRDAWGRLVYVQAPTGGGGNAYYGYDLRDNLVQVDLQDKTSLYRQSRFFEYDPLNRLRLSSNPEGGTETVSDYDTLGNPLRRRDASGDLLISTYDGAGRLEKLERQEYQKPGGPVPPIVTLLTNTYDQDGGTRCPNGQPSGGFGCSYGRLTTAVSLDDTGAWVHTRELYYSGLNGRLSNERNFFAGVSSATTFAINTLHNLFGLPVQITYPEGRVGKGGAFTLGVLHNNGYPIRAQDVITQALMARLEYDAQGGVRQVETGGGVRTVIAPDTRNRPQSITIGKWDTSANAFVTPEYYASGAYGYDGAGNIWQIGPNLFGYDAANRLAKAEVYPENIYRRQVYTYDDFGNMKQRDLYDSLGSLIAVDLFTTTDQTTGSNSNRVLSHQNGSNVYTFRYDPQGNLIRGDSQSFEYDARNRLLWTRQLSGAAGQAVAQYSYDGTASRLRKEDPARDASTFYVRDSQGRLMSEFRSTRMSFSVPEWSKHYIYIGNRLVSLRENRLPNPPAGLSAKIGSGQITLSWKANPAIDGVAGYKLYRAVQASSPSWYLVTTTTGLSFVDAVTSGTWYQYQITALSPAGEGYPSDLLVVQAGDTTKPTTPTGLAGIAANTRVDLAWNHNPPTEYVTGYHVYRAEGTQKVGTKLTQVPVPSSSFADINLLNGTEYRYTVSAVDNVGLESSRTAELKRTPGDFLPPAPVRAVVALSDCAGGTSTISLSWQANEFGDGLRRYLLYREPPFPSNQAGLPPGARHGTLGTVYVDAETTPGMTYRYRVIAEDMNANTSEASLEAVATSRLPRGAIPVPRSPSVKSGDGVVTLRLQETPAAGHGVGVYRRVNSDADCRAYEYLGLWPGINSDFEDPAAKNDVAYDYALTYIESATSRESDFSATALATPVGRPMNFTTCNEMTRGLQTWKDGAACCYSFCDGEVLGRQILRWEAPGATMYTPLTATTGDGTLGFLKGYHIYQYTADRDLLVPKAIDYRKRYCKNNPHIPCGVVGQFLSGAETVFVSDSPCPQGDTCTSASRPTVGICFPDSRYECNSDRDCAAGSVCQTPCSACSHQCSLDFGCSDPLPDPYLTIYKDRGINVYQRLESSNRASCLAVTAVHKVFANGTWLTVESGFSDNFDPSRQETDASQRCVEFVPDTCNVEIPKGVCAFDKSVPPMPPPAAPTTNTSEGPGTLTVTWQPAPGGVCRLEFPVSCRSDTDCGAGQFCSKLTPSHLDGACALPGETVCSADTDCPQGQFFSDGQICEPVPIAGYHLYVRESPRYLFSHPFPFESLPPDTTSYTFRNLGAFGLRFSVASFDGSGRISAPSPESAPGSTGGEAASVAPPRTVRTRVWTINDPSWPEIDGIKIQWTYQGIFGSLNGFRVWRSTTPGGPYCALVRPGGTGLAVCPGGSANASSQTLTTGGASSFIDKTAQAGVVYFYVVTAVTSAGESAYSVEVRGKALGRDNAPSPPAHFRAWSPKPTADTTKDQTGVYLGWCPNLSIEGVTGYEIFRSTQSMGPYALLATVPAACVGQANRCEINQVGATLTPAATCTPGIDGNCKIIDKTVATDGRLYYYVATAVRGSERSGYSRENAGASNRIEFGIWYGSWDPDNFAEGPCGDAERASLDVEQEITDRDPVGEKDLAGFLAPYQVIGARDPNPSPGPGPSPSSGPPAPAANPRFVFFHLDHLGSPRVITDSTGNVVSRHFYMPFGEEMPVNPQNTTNTRQFTGHERDDESGMDYMLARYYGSSLSRFMSPDPLSPLVYQHTDRPRFVNFLERPQAWDRYSYVFNNPILYVDPNGLEGQSFEEWIQVVIEEFCGPICKFITGGRAGKNLRMIAEVKKFYEEATRFAIDHPENREAERISSEAEQLRGMVDDPSNTPTIERRLARLKERLDVLKKGYAEKERRERELERIIQDGRSIDRIPSRSPRDS